jgi:luciferase family oxidoreductase group 1
MSAQPDISILDLVPVSEGGSGAVSLGRVADLAQLGEALGYKRIWYAEHHGMPAIASSSAEVLIAHAAAKTSHIQVGSGGVMLPNHVPLRIVETYRTLAALYPNRIDLGIGRAGGTDSKTLRALHSFGGEYFAHQVAEMLGYDAGVTEAPHPHPDITTVPDGINLPPIWVLGSSGASAEFAGGYGFGYGFAAHFSDTPAKPAFDAYRASFKPSAAFPEPKAILCLAVVCAETEEEATWQTWPVKLNWRNLSLGTPQRLQSPEVASKFPFTLAEERMLQARMNLIISGTPEQVRDEVLARAEQTGADEVMIASTLYDHQARLDSYRLLARALDLKPLA